MTKRLNLWLLALAIIFAVPYYWLLVDDRPGEVEPRALTIQQLRMLAAAQDGHPPTSIRYITLGFRLIPRTVLAAGQGIKLVRYSARAYRLEVPGYPPIMIDSGLSAADASRNGLETYLKHKQDLANAELRKAQLIITLGDGVLHSGGLRMLGIESSGRKHADHGDCPGPRALAAGVVEIPVCDRVMASRMVYVRLEDGREFLFAGDISPTILNTTQQAGPSRLMDLLYGDQDRRAIRSWLATIARLKKQAPDLVLVPGHAPIPAKDMANGFLHLGRP